eukprot:gb/GECG01016026.1/.p1 GENE.gb/GECG01016026.1/~~gb/GECG01016026.1/.p1  ORF type:complete len:447 (+),score=55.76 gb/GECG01016026.1/:1-1341(+)
MKSGSGFRAQGPNTLRGGQRSYGSKTLYSNWFEDRMDPRFPGAYHGSTTEYEARNQQALHKSDPYYGAALKAHMEDVKETQFNYDNLISPDKRLDESSWKSVTQISHESPMQQLENSTRQALGTNILSLTSSAALKPAKQIEENELNSYSQRWIRDNNQNSAYRFVSSQSWSLNDAAPNHLKKTSTRVLPGTPKSFEFFREKLLIAGGAYAIRMVGKSLKMMANGELACNEPCFVSREAFSQVLRDCGITFSVDEFKELAQYLAKDESGLVDISVFYNGLKGEMSKERRELTEQAFKSLSDDGQFIPVGRLCDCFDPRGDRDVMLGNISAEVAKRRFDSEWKHFRKQDGSGSVSLESFVDYYADVSAAIDLYEDYEAVIQNSWHLITQNILDNSPCFCVLLIHSDGSEQMVKAKKHPWLNTRDKNGIMNVLRHQGYNDVYDVSIDF